MSVKGRQSSRRSTDACKSGVVGAVEMEAGGGDVDGDHVALLAGPGTAAAADGLTSSPATAKLDASAPIALDISPPTSRRAPSLKRRPTVQSSSSAGRPSWKLKYQDFTPTVSTSLLTSMGCPAGGVSLDSSDAFQKLLDDANEWLHKNTEMQVKSCETVTWMSHDVKSLSSSSSELMVLSKRVAERVQTFNVRGLRVWLTPQTVNKRQYLCVADFVPTPVHDTIQSLVANVNDSIDRGQLKGQIVSVETLNVPIQSGVVDCDVTRWTECADTDIPCAFVLRVYYNREVNGRIYGSEKVHVGIMDFVPQPTDNTYEGFEDLIDRMNRWLRELRSVQVINIQSIMVQKHDGPHSETGSTCFYSQPGANRPVPVDFFRILRVVYLKPIGGDLLVDLPVVSPLSYETFTPDLVKCKELAGSQRERVEKMKETFAKVTAFLHASGVEVFCAETVMNPMQLYPQDNVNVLPPADEIKFLLTLRLYFSSRSASVRRDGSVRSTKRTSLSSTRGGAQPAPSSSAPGQGANGPPSRTSPRNSDNSVHPGPIFLRHVVSRPFEYRWLILATSVITCMAIIVIVSVVYSNF